LETLVFRTKGSQRELPESSAIVQHRRHSSSRIGHKRLTVKFQGLDARLTGISGDVVRDILV
jgi:hypothetical protein